MKKTISLIGLALVLVICFCNWVKPVYCYKEQYAEKQTEITFNEVNVRNKPNGKVLGIMTQNEDIILTGNFYKAIANERNSEWVEITYNGEKAWITARAVKWYLIIP